MKFFEWKVNFSKFKRPKVFDLIPKKKLCIKSKIVDFKNT